MKKTKLHPLEASLLAMLAAYTAAVVVLWEAAQWLWGLL